MWPEWISSELLAATPTDARPVEAHRAGAHSASQSDPIRGCAMTNVFISIDMEGIAGIAHLQQVIRGTDDFQASRELVTEAELNAAFAGTYGVPVGLVTGDDKICAVSAKKIPGIRTVVVKEAFGRNVARSLHPQAAREAIRKAAAEAVAARQE